MAVPNVDDSIQAAAAFRALSDPFRLHMFAVLRDLCAAEGGPEKAVEFSAAIDETARALNMSPSLAEQHLLELARAGLIHVSDDPVGRPLLTLNLDLVRKISTIIHGPDESA